MEAVQIGGVKTLIPTVRALAHPTWKDPKFDIALDICTRELFNVAGLLESLIDAIQAKQIQTAPDLKAPRLAKQRRQWRGRRTSASE